MQDFSTKINAFVVDEQGYIIEYILVLPYDVLERNVIKVIWNQRLFVSKWDFENSLWIEGLTPEEVAIREQEINDQKQQIPDEEMNGMAILELSNIILGG
ncbi:hypothetical protein [Metabacillus niabensis]|uniref:Uncharacterized protein n=1 Tax=Metabacillus niabensis TaxID=324854 RepID=A0ABT9Z819_9BACI|nr:hypothetical protein [Metabacillus niabensis]MDQ0228406.1 hypothetical protein [Metabacillus niabensis]